MSAVSCRVVAQVLGLMALVTACTEDDPPPPPANFSRPEDVAFVCLRLGEDEAEALPLSECPNPRLDATSASVLHALVTQTSTGEIAAVEIRDHRTSIGIQPGRVIDSRTDIPGYTFVDVGAVPSGILVPAEHPKFTYVISEGAKTLAAFHTAAFRPVQRELEASAGEPIALGVRPRAMVLGPAERFLYISAPHDGAVLRVQLCHECEASQHFGSVERLVLTVPDASLAVGAEPAQASDEAYTSDDVCNSEPCPLDVAGANDCAYTFRPGPALAVPVLPAATTLDPSAGARPASMALDVSQCEDPTDAECSAVLLVGDENLPVIHRFQLGAGDPVALPPLETRVPVSDVVVTPMVPVAPAADEFTHYVYAIDALDGSVLAMQDGQLLTVGDVPNLRADRIGMISRKGERALSLEVVTPGFFERHGTCGLTATDDSPGAPHRLRGVYLLVGTTSGMVRVIDVHDLDLDSLAQSTESACRGCPIYIKRHRPRLGVDVGAQILPVPPASVDVSYGPVVDAPAYVSTGQRLGVRANGGSRDANLPDLQCLSCDGLDLAAAFPRSTLAIAQPDTSGSSSTTATTPDVPRPATSLAGGAGSGAPDAGAMDAPQEMEPETDGLLDEEEGACPDGQARVCALGDPWAATNDFWQLEFEGAIPGAAGNEGRAERDGDGNWVLQVQVDHCADGVLAGDQVVINGVPDESVRERWRAQDAERCQEYVDAREDPADVRAAGFVITEAYEDRLVFEDPAVDRFGDLPQTFEHLQRCFTPPGGAAEDLPQVPRALAYQIRAYRSFTVQGARTGFLHDVSAVDGRCQVGAPRTSGRSSTGRARLPDAATAAEQAATGTCRVGDRNLFDNGHIALCLGLPPDVSPPRDRRIFLRLQTELPSPHLSLDANVFGFGAQTGVLPLLLRYNAKDLRVYMVDPFLRGLLPIPLDTFPAALTSSASHFN